MIKTITFDEFQQRASRRSKNSRVPYAGTIELTSRCNLSCVHCYINRPPDDPAEIAAELSTQEWIGQIDAMADKGCLWLLVTGGEPLLRHDFFDIYGHAKRKGMFVTIFTNGTLVTPGLAERLFDLPPHGIEVTIYGADPAIHDRVTGISGSFEATMAGVRLLLKKGLAVELKTIALTMNSSQIDAMNCLANSMKLKFRYDPMINPRLDGGKGPLQYRLAAEEILALDLANEERLASWKEYCQRSIGPQKQPELLYHCGAGLQSFHIDAFGRFSICLMERGHQYDLRKGTFSHAWDWFASRERFRERTTQSQCTTCELISVCSQCPAWFSLESGSMEAPLDFCCRIAKMRVETFVGDTKSMPEVPATTAP